MRESLTCCKENSELVRIKAKEKEREQDGDLAAKEGLSDVVTQLDVYTLTGRGSEHLNDRSLVGCRISIIGPNATTVVASVQN